jgi:hypothetical protein
LSGIVADASGIGNRARLEQAEGQLPGGHFDALYYRKWPKSVSFDRDLLSLLPHIAPEHAGTYLKLRAAELASRALREPEDQRRFVAQVRSALADDIERGEPLQPVRLRDRSLRSRASRLNEDPQPSR